MFNGYQATVLIPKNFNGKWIWKTEFYMLLIRQKGDFMKWVMQEFIII